MAKFRKIQNSLIAGEISPKAFGRTDLPQYAHACKEYKNFIPFISGGGYGRPGTLYDSHNAVSTDYSARLIPFVRSNSEAYCLYISKVAGGSGYIEAFRATDNDSASSGATVTGTHAFIAGLTSGLEDEWHSIQYAQSVDVMWLVHPNRKPHKVHRTAANAFRVTTFEQDSAGVTFTGATRRDAWPYLPQNTTAITITPSATSGTGISLTASAAFFNALHVGAIFKLNHSGTYGCAIVTGFTSNLIVTADVIVNFGAGTAVATWWESAWSDYRGWPQAICFHKSRLGYGGTTHNPDTSWWTENNDYNQLSHDSIVDPYSAPSGTQAFSYQVASQHLNHIQWMSGGRVLTKGTSSSEWLVSPLVAATGFVCNNLIGDEQSTLGSHHRQAVKAGKEVIFALNANDEVRSLVFNEVEEQYVDEPIQLLFSEYPKPNNHSYKQGYRGFCWDPTRKTLWCWDKGGHLFGLTRDRKLGVSAWHTHELGGYDESVYTGGASGSGGTLSFDPTVTFANGSIVSAAVVPNPLIGTHDLWLVVKRKINGTWGWYLERMIGKELDYDAATDSTSNGNGTYFTDCSVFALNELGLGGEDYTFSEAAHLEGETPVATVISAFYGLFSGRMSSVSSGSTSIQTPYPYNFDGSAYALAIGLPFETVVRPVRPDAGSQIGTALGAIMRIHNITVGFYKTLSAKVGRDADNLEEINFRASDTPMSNSAELFTGTKLLSLDADYDREADIYILNDEPLPFALTHLVLEGQTYD